MFCNFFSYFYFSPFEIDGETRGDTVYTLENSFFLASLYIVAIHTRTYIIYLRTYIIRCTNLYDNTADVKIKRRDRQAEIYATLLLYFTETTARRRVPKCIKVRYQIIRDSGCRVCVCFRSIAITLCGTISINEHEGTFVCIIVVLTSFINHTHIIYVYSHHQCRLHHQ